jgi:hypothetical protein
MTRPWLALAAFLAFPAVGQAQTPPEPAVVYEVKAGDNLYTLATRYFLQVSDAGRVQRLNQIREPRRLPVGRRLTIPAEWLRSEPLTARLVAYTGAVTVRGPGAGALARDMEIREGFELATGANAFLTFELPDGSRTTLPSQSRIRVDRLRRILLTGAVQRDLQLLQGRSNSVVTPIPDPASRFRILTPLSVSAVRGTEFRVSFDDAAERATLEVIEGKVAGAAQASPAETLVPAGFGAATTREGQTPPQALLPRPTLQNASKLQDDPQVAFNLQTLTGASGYRAQVATDAGFIDVIAETTASQPALTFETVANGTYFARFTAVDGVGLEGIPAAYAFERRLTALGLDPPDAVGGAKRQYRFKWRSSGGGTESFRFTLARDADGSRAVIDEAGLTDGQIVVTDLPPGIYFWRVLVSQREGGKLYEKWSQPQRFEIGG